MAYTSQSLLDNYIDYYASGMIGEYTTRYINAFDKISSKVRVIKFEPLTGVLLAQGRTEDGYTSTVSSTNVLIDPQSFEFPIRVDGSTDFESIIDRDIRKVFFYPNFFISRNYIYNLSSDFRRTIWLLSFAGKEYEISQVVPRFINNQIVYYEANLYVTIPNNDPFIRDTYPGET